MSGAMKNTRLLIFAVLCAGVAAALAFSFLAAQSRRIADHGTVVTIAVAKRDLPPYHRLDPEVDLRIEKIPERQFPELARYAMKVADCRTFAGRELTAMVPAGLPLRYGHFAPVTDLLIEDGKRAMGVSIANAAGLDQLLVPGDYIDLLVTRSLPTTEDTPETQRDDGQPDMNTLLEEVLGEAPPAEGWRSEVVLHEVLVLTVGSALSGTREELGLSQGRKRSGSSRTITIEVTLDQARTLLEATGAGQHPLTVLLRSDRRGSA
jgi:Flp pilus assembly protein CpaB